MWPAGGLAGQPPSHTPQPPISCCCPHPPPLPHSTALRHRTPGQRESSFCPLWPLASQFFTVLIVSGFVLRNKKHFRIIFTFMIKPSACESDPSLVTRGVWSLLARLVSSQLPDVL